MSLSYLSGSSPPQIVSSLINSYPFTIAFLVKPTALVTDSPFFQYCYDTTQGTYDIAFLFDNLDTSIGDLADFLALTSSTIVGASGSIVLNGWQAIVVRCDTAYTDYDSSSYSATPDTTNKGAWGVTANNPKLTLFNKYGGGKTGTYGKIANLAIYAGYLLSDAEAAQWAAMNTDPVSIASADMTNYWADPGANQIDSIGGIALTLNGATYDSTDNPSFSTYSISGSIPISNTFAANSMTYTPVLGSYSIISNITLTIDPSAASMVYTPAPAGNNLSGSIDFPRTISSRLHYHRYGNGMRMDMIGIRRYRNRTR